MPEQCPFCQLLENPEKTIRIHESDNYIAFIDINPGTKGQTIIASKEHFSSLEEVPKKIIGEGIEVAHTVAEKAKNGLNADGVSISINSGEAAGQRIPHFFIKVFPRYQSEEKSGMPVGAIFQPKDMDQEELVKIGKKMKDASFSKKKKGSSAGFVGPSENIDDKGESEEKEEPEEREVSSSEKGFSNDPAEFV